MEHLKAKYQAFPELEPYTKTDRYSLLREDHKFFIQKIRQLVETTKVLDVADLACGNGELINQLKKIFPHWNYTGFDLTPEFIATAENYEGLKGVRFITCDWFETHGEYDLVLSSGSFQIMQDVEKALGQMLNICRGDGYIITDGLFNPFDVEVRIQYCDNSMEATKGIWRADWNTHSRWLLSEFLKTRNVDFEFEDLPFNIELHRKEGTPHVNNFTFKDEHGKTHVTNGLNILNDKSMLTIHKPLS